jgi:predicted nuclease of predicted toxin-antitoxin system
MKDINVISNDNQIGFYLDEHMPKDVAKGLRARGHRVIRAVDVGMTGKDDDTEHLPYATQNRLIMVTFDHPFATRTLSRADFMALVCLNRKIRNDYGRVITLLAEFLDLFDENRDAGQVRWLR